MKTLSLLASIVALVGCSLYDAEPDKSSRGEIVGHRGGVAIYASDLPAAASITGLGSPAPRADDAQPASAPTPAPAGQAQPAVAAPGTPACEPGQADCPPTR